MIRFFTRLFGSRTPASAKPARRALLSVETLETRESPSGLSVAYQITIQSTASHKVEKRIEKKNTLTVSHLASGNYTTSHNVIEGHKDLPKTNATLDAPHHTHLPNSR